MQLTGFTVLVVEDDVDNLELLISHLEQEGALVLGTESMKAALSVTLEHDVDAVICDLELPDGDGCALLQKLRSREGCKDLPAIAITGYSDPTWRRAADECGFSRYALKPFSLELLTDWLGELIDGQSGVVGSSCHAVTDPAVRGLQRR